MAEPQNAPNRAAMMKILLPAGAVALLVILVAVLWSASSEGRPMSDGSNGSANDPGLFTTASGLKYRDLDGKEGSGPGAPPGSTVTVSYTGWLTDGSVFDSSSKTSFSLNEVVAGWKEGIPGMKVGGTRKLVIPPELGYANQAKPKIPPGSTLIFEVTMIDFKGGSGGVPPRELTDKTKPGDEDKDLIDVRPGLKYRDLKVGDGPAARERANITIHYTGWLMNGTPFDSSRKTGEPANFDLNRLIKGWQYGIPGMKVGGIRKLVIEGDLAYGPEGDPRAGIGPSATLVFEIELLGTN